MLIKITKTHHRALNPRTTVTLKLGSVQDFENCIAVSLINSGLGVEYKELKQKIDNKAFLEVPEVKSEEIPEEAPKKILEEYLEETEILYEDEPESLSEEILEENKEEAPKEPKPTSKRNKRNKK
tara:strand:+ start:7917 stop:8291 length:375 start_codon:yes stop_codon:yes gene_type:complete